ncbi:MAG TPA: hypothetical protein PK280_09600 [Planctomycetota bacterium]|nr:hypothetical protein [Planctomycetota bacterium]
MRRLALSLLVLAPALAAGCGPRGYFTDRWRDAKDVFSASVGTGGGAKARVGPVQVGALFNSDFAGFRGGTGFHLTQPFSERAGQVLDMASPVPLPWPSDKIRFPLTSAEGFNLEYCEGRFDRAAVDRDKTYNAIFPFIPLLTVSDRPYYYTQVEAVVGVGGTLRLGFNPGELLDFLLGWTTLDIYGDDLEARWERQAPRAKAALLALMRAEPKLFEGADPERFAALGMKPAGYGKYAWGAFTVNLAERTYAAAISSEAAFWHYRGHFYGQRFGEWQAANIEKQHATAAPK